MGSIRTEGRQTDDLLRGHSIYQGRCGAFLVLPSRIRLSRLKEDKVRHRWIIELRHPHIFGELALGEYDFYKTTLNRKTGSRSVAYSLKPAAGPPIALRKLGGVGDFTVSCRARQSQNHELVAIYCQQGLPQHSQEEQPRTGTMGAFHRHRGTHVRCASLPRV